MPRNKKFPLNQLHTQFLKPMGISKDSLRAFAFELAIEDFITIETGNRFSIRPKFTDQSQQSNFHQIISSYQR